MNRISWAHVQKKSLKSTRYYSIDIHGCTTSRKPLLITVVKILHIFIYRCTTEYFRCLKWELRNLASFENVMKFQIKIREDKFSIKLISVTVIEKCSSGLKRINVLQQIRIFSKSWRIRLMPSLKAKAMDYADLYLLDSHE